MSETLSFPRAWTCPNVLATGVVAAMLMIVSLSSSVEAQDVIDMASTPRVVFGPVGLTPSVDVAGAGIDTNVFNEADNRKRDFMAIVVPSVDATLRTGRFAAKLSSDVALVYFNRYTNQRAVNTAHELTLAARFHRLTPFARFQYVNARERPSIEIDARVRRRNIQVGGGVNLALGVKSSVRFEVNELEMAFADDAVFEGANLQTLYDQRSTSGDGSFRYELTPLTRLVVTVQRQQDRFEFTPARDSNSLRISPGLEFAPTALISGRISIGVRSFDLADPQVPDFTGLVAAADLTFTLRGVTQFTARVNRDLAYSYSVTAPYYILTSLGGTVTQRLTSHWDLSGFGDHQRLNYQRPAAVAGRPVATAAPPDLTAPGGLPIGTAYVAGGGLAYRFGRDSRVSFLVEYSTRPAGIRGEYENLRAYSTITYGF